MNPSQAIIKVGSELHSEVDANGWPVVFFEETAGAWAGEPLIREPQGEYEQHLELE